MTPQVKRLAIPLLHWSVGPVVLWQSCRTSHLAFLKVHALGHSGALAGVRLVLSGCEIVAAILFLVPFTAIAGGYLLLVIFAVAIIIHTLHGDFSGMDTLLVYGAAVLACMAYRDQTKRT
jgi:hypothetical protein